VLTISDTGPGISPEDQPTLFDRFTRVDKTRSRESGGSGLGLAICKEIAEAHGGSIRLSSPPGEGASFAISLAAITGSEAAAPAQTAHDVQGVLREWARLSD
jgi:two-component system sensor histidine kinase BaeS